MPQVCEAGVGSVRPLAVAATVNVCHPSGSPVYEAGELHPVAAPPSREQPNVEPPTVDVKAKVAVVAFTVPLGPEVMVVFGAVGPPPGALIVTLST